MKAVIIGNNDQHSTEMVSAFVLGYNNSINTYNPKGLTPITSNECYILGSYNLHTGMLYAKNHNIPLAIKSTTGASSTYYLLRDDASYSELYPYVTLFMPAGANQLVKLYSNPITEPICITGAGDISNETAYNVEFISPDPIKSDPQDYSSFSNPYIAAQLLFIAESLNCSIWKARQRAMETGTEKGKFQTTNGYGFINVKNAITYNTTLLPNRIKAKKEMAKTYRPFFLKKQPTFIIQKKEPRSFNHKILDEA